MKFLHIMVPSKRMMFGYIYMLRDKFKAVDHRILFRGGIPKSEQVLRQFENVTCFDDFGKGKLNKNKGLKREMNNADRIVLHGMNLDWKIIFFLFIHPKFLKKCSWVIWGIDLYNYKRPANSLKNKVLNFFDTYCRKHINYPIALLEPDVDVYHELIDAREVKCAAYPISDNNWELMDEYVERTKRKAEEKLLAEKQAEEERFLDEQRELEEKAEQERFLDEQRELEEKAEQEKSLKEKAAKYEAIAEKINTVKTYISMAEKASEAMANSADFNKEVLNDSDDLATRIDRIISKDKHSGNVALLDKANAEEALQAFDDIICTANSDEALDEILDAANSEKIISDMVESEKSNRDFTLDLKISKNHSGVNITYNKVYKEDTKTSEATDKNAAPAPKPVAPAPKPVAPAPKPAAPVPKPAEQPTFLIVGNNAHSFNKHYKTLNQLSHLKNDRIVMYIPVSYGNDYHTAVNGYVDTLREYAKELYPEEKCRFMTRLMPQDEYTKHLMKMDIGIYNAERQNALGNINKMLYMGKKVYMSDKSPLYKFYLSKGFEIHNVNELDNITFEELKKPIQVDFPNPWLKEYYSREGCARHWKNVFDWISGKETSK